MPTEDFVGAEVGRVDLRLGASSYVWACDVEAYDSRVVRTLEPDEYPRVMNQLEPFE